MAVAGAEVGIRVNVEVGSATVGVRVGPMAVGVRVDVGSGGASRLISKERTDDQALLMPPAVRARTRHQKGVSAYSAQGRTALVAVVEMLATMVLPAASLENSET